MSEAFSFPPQSAPTLRELFADPLRELGLPHPQVRDAVLDLARWITGSAQVALITGASAPADLDLTELTGIERRGDGRTVLPLRVPLHPSGEGASRVFGALVLQGPSPEIDLERLARHAAAGLINDGLRRFADRDGLTRLSTRAAFERELPGMAEVLAKGESVAVVLLDVDGLRDVNATRGVRAGDDLLKTLSVLTLGALGGRGISARYGGDELALLVPGADAAAGKALVEGLQQSVSQIVGFGQPAPTVSIGIASGPEHGDDLEVLVFRADQALARAKEEGRGKLVVWEPGLKRMRRLDRLAGVLTGHGARDYRHVQALLATVQDVSGLAPLQQTLTRTVDRCLEIAGAERGLLVLREGEGWTVRTARGPGGSDLPQDQRSFAASIAESALDEARSLSRLSEDGPISPSAEALGLSAVLCAPLLGDDVPRGVLYVDTRSRSEPYDAATLAFFDALVRQVTVALRNSVLYERLLAKTDRLESKVAGREEELVKLRQRWQEAQGVAGDAEPVQGLVGSSQAMQEVFGLLESLEGTSVPVVVEGESGTGKELVSRAIHQGSGRSGPLITVNCAAIAPNLFESELFGHRRGSFTGAHTDREGLLEAANEGTLFMDEVGELPLEAQAKLLRALQEGEIRRIGESENRPIDVRIVAATNRDLLEMVKTGEFREDLYYRLTVFRVYLPPLRDRVEDIPLIAKHLLDNIEGGLAELSHDAIRVLVKQRWPGNVRQLRNVLERAAVMAGPGGRIGPEHLEETAAEKPTEAFSTSDLLQLPLKDAKAAFSILYAKEMVRRANGSMPEAAKLAGVTRQTLYRILAD